MFRGSPKLRLTKGLPCRGPSGLLSWTDRTCPEPSPVASSAAAIAAR